MESFKENNIDISDRLDKLNHFISQFNLIDGIDLCRFITNHFLKYDQNWIYSNDFSINLWFIAFLAKQLLLFASEKNKKDISLNELKYLSREFAVISEGSLGLFKEKDYMNNLSSIIKADYERRFWQEPIVYLLPRIWYTLIETPFKNYQDNQDNFRDKIEKLYNINFKDFIRIAISFAAMYSKSNSFNIKYLVDTKDDYFKNWFTEEKLNIVLSHFCIEHNEFIEEQNKINNIEIKNYIYQFNYLRKKPLIKIGNKIICPLPILIADRLSTGIYFDLADYYEQNGLKRSDFTTDYGKLFEAYVGLLLSVHYNIDKNLFHAEKFISTDTKSLKKKPSICDWVVIEKNTVILLECKSGKLPATIASTGNEKYLHDFVLNNYLNKGNLQFDYLFNYFKNQKKDVYSLLIYNDVLNIYNNYEIIFPNDNDIIKKIKKYKTQFISIYDFERLVTQLSNYQLCDILDKKSKDAYCHKCFDELFTKLDKYDPKLSLSIFDKVWKENVGFSPQDAARISHQ